MKVFLDTSALTKKYVLERGSERIIEIFSKPGRKFISIICFPEIVSVLSRLKREKAITDTQYHKLRAFIIDDLKNFYLCELTTQVIKRSVVLLESFSLKTLDALQIACAIEFQSELFISADHQQTRAAHQAGLKIEEV